MGVLSRPTGFCPGMQFFDTMIGGHFSRGSLFVYTGNVFKGSRL